MLRCPRLAIVVTAVTLVACIPLKVSEQHVVATTRSEPVAADWDPTIGPDVHMAFAHRFKTVMREQSDRVEIVDPDDVWKAAGVGEPGTEAKLSEVLSVRSGGLFDDLGIRYLIVLGPETKPVRKQVIEAAAFYSKWTVETSREAVLVGIAGPMRGRLRYIAAASGEEHEGWVPGTPLIFARLYSTSDTEESALKALARQVVDRILSASTESPVRVALFAGKVGP